MVSGASHTRNHCSGVIALWKVARLCFCNVYFECALLSLSEALNLKVVPCSTWHRKHIQYIFTLHHIPSDTQRWFFCFLLSFLLWFYSSLPPFVTIFVTILSFPDFAFLLHSPFVVFRSTFVYVFNYFCIFPSSRQKQQTSEDKRAGADLAIGYVEVK